MYQFFDIRWERKIWERRDKESERKKERERDIERNKWDSVANEKHKENKRKREPVKKCSEVKGKIDVWAVSLDAL